jgi:hypothetical protein
MDRVEKNVTMILLGTRIANYEREELWDAFFAMNALDFAKHLHGLAIPESVKAQLLAERTAKPLPESARTEVQAAVEAITDAIVHDSAFAELAEREPESVRALLTINDCAGGK